MRSACYESKTWDARYDSWHCSSQLTERRVHIAWSQTRLLLLWSEQLIGGKADRQWVYGDSAPSSLCLIVCLCLSICVWVGRHLPAALKIDGGNLQRVLMMTQNWLQSWICRFSSWITHTHTHACTNFDQLLTDRRTFSLCTMLNLCSSPYWICGPGVWFNGRMKHSLIPAHVCVLPYTLTQLNMPHKHTYFKVCTPPPVRQHKWLPLCSCQAVGGRMEGGRLPRTVHQRRKQRESNRREAVKDVTGIYCLTPNNNCFFSPAGVCFVESVWVMCEDAEQRWLGQRPVTCLHTASSNHHVMNDIMIVEAQKASPTSAPIFQDYFDSCKLSCFVLSGFLSRNK